jgi:tetratricopeptide (TPR) repeat protein
MNNEPTRKNRLATLIGSLENLKLSFPLAVLTFSVIVFARAFLEGIFERGHTIGLHPVTEVSIYNVFLHFPVYYLFVLIASVLFLHFITRERIDKVGKILLAFFPIILIPPLVDLFATPGKGDALFYFMEIKDFGRALYGTFVPTMVLRGVSLGIRIEVFIGCMLAAIYCGVKVRKWIVAPAAFLGIYIILVISGAIPVLSARFISLFHASGASPYEFAYRSGGMIPTETQRVTLITLLPLLVLAPLALYRWSPRIFRAAFRTARSYLSVHFLVMTMTGFVLAYVLSRGTGIPLIGHPLDYVAMCSVLITVFLAYQAMIHFEQAIEAPNGARTLIAVTLLGSSFMIAFSISYVSLLILIGFCLVFFFYLAPPFRVKRIFPVSTLFLSFASLVAVVLGFSLFTGEKAAFLFSPRISLLIIVLFTLTFSLKDLPTIAQDRKLKLLTLPIMIGEERGRWVTALLTAVGFLSVPLILGEYLLFIPAVIIAASLGVLVLGQRWRKWLGAAGYAAIALFVIPLFFHNGAAIARDTQNGFCANRAFHKANDLRERGYDKEALVLYESVLEEGYEAAHLYRNAGLLYLKQGNVPKAIDAFEKALGSTPDDQDIRILLIQAYVRAGMADRALRICETGIASGTYRAEFLMLKGEVYLAQRAPSKAFEAFKQSIKAGESTGNSYLALGSIYLSLDSLNEAIDAYSQALKLSPGSQPLKHRAEAHFRNGNLEAALSDLLAAEVLNPNDPETKNNIAIIHFRKGNYRTAEEYLLEAISLDRNYIVAYQNLSDTYEKTGQNEKAAQVQSKINEIISKELNND